MTPRYFVGCKPGQLRIVFSCTSAPTAESYPQFGYAIGPFRTRRAAVLMASAAAVNNPHIRTVADAERIARQAKGVDGGHTYCHDWVRLYHHRRCHPSLLDGE